MKSLSLILLVCLAISLAKATQLNAELQIQMDLLKNTINKLSLESEHIQQIQKAQQDLENKIQSLVESKQVAYEYLTISSPNRDGIFILGPLEEHLRKELKLDDQGKIADSDTRMMFNGEFLKVLNTLGSAGWKVISAHLRDQAIPSNWYVLERPQRQQQTNATVEPLVATEPQKESAVLSGNELLEKAIQQFQIDSQKAKEGEQNRTQKAKEEELERKFKENEKNLKEAVQIIRNSFMEQAKAGNTKFVSPWFFPSLEQLVQAIKKDRDERMNTQRQIVPEHGTEPFEEIKDAVITQLKKEKERLGLVFLDELKPYQEALVHHLKKFHGLDIGVFSSKNRSYGDYGYNFVQRCLVVQKDWKEPVFVEHGLDFGRCEPYEGMVGYPYYAIPVALLGNRFYWIPPKK